MKATSLSRRRRIIFRFVCVCLPLVGLALLEGVLRLFGWGGYSDFFRELPLSDGTTLVVSDVAGSSNYFYANREKPGTNDEFSFVMPKPAGTTRIFLCGESAIKGFPQPRAFAAGEFLEQMLQGSLAGSPSGSHQSWNDGRCQFSGARHCEAGRPLRSGPDHSVRGQQRVLRRLRSGVGQPRSGLSSAAGGVSTAYDHWASCKSHSS